MTQPYDSNTMETILELGAEGGALTLQGQQLSADEWEFTLYKSSMPAEIDGAWTYEDTGPVSSLDEALDLLTQTYEAWPMLRPMQIHPDFYTQLFIAVQNRAALLNSSKYESWIRRVKPEWLRLASASSRYPASPKLYSSEVQHPMTAEEIEDKGLLERVSFQNANPVRGDWTYCRIEHKRFWNIMDGEDRSMSLLVSNGSLFEFQKDLLVGHKQGSTREQEIKDDQELLKAMLDRLQQYHWKIINTEEGQSHSDTGGEQWQRITLKKQKPSL